MILPEPILHLIFQFKGIKNVYTLKIHLPFSNSNGIAASLNSDLKIMDQGFMFKKCWNAFLKIQFVIDCY